MMVGTPVSKLHGGATACHWRGMSAGRGPIALIEDKARAYRERTLSKLSLLQPERSRLLDCLCCGRPFAVRGRQQGAGRHLERLGKTFYEIDARSVNLTFKRADIGAVDSHSVRQLFLRQAIGLAQSLQISSKGRADRHPQQNAELSSIQPRSILFMWSIAADQRERGSAIRPLQAPLPQEACQISGFRRPSAPQPDAASRTNKGRGRCA